MLFMATLYFIESKCDIHQEHNTIARAHLYTVFSIHTCTNSCNMYALSCLGVGSLVFHYQGSGFLVWHVAARGQGWCLEEVCVSGITQHVA